MDWIRGNTAYLSVFSPNVRLYGPEKNPYLDTFHAVIPTPFSGPKIHFKKLKITSERNLSFKHWSGKFLFYTFEKGKNLW